MMEQNDQFLDAQHILWNHDVVKYDGETALQQKAQGVISFEIGSKALSFLNTPNRTVPYIIKDPRMCITLPTWLKLLTHSPAIVFTYRHPMEVASSLAKRDLLTMKHGLYLWIVYNMRAIQNSKGLCRVFTSNERIVSNPSVELQRIANELIDSCNMIAPPTLEISNEVVGEFVDASLRHNHQGSHYKCTSIAKTVDDDDERKAMMERHNDSTLKTNEQYAEDKMRSMAMKLFCDLESGVAYSILYEWSPFEDLVRLL